uniref:Aminotransferase class I/classII domain-containing protein n=1 Tax=Panagrolaimus superbus TaxID=310955 RepID=A0A914XXH5_9BILA
MEDAILYSSCFDANGGLFETLLGAEDAIISDALNHASIIDGVRLCKAKRYRYANNDMQELEARLKEAREAGARHVLIATDGVFSMDGVIANLKGVCDLADKYDALVMVDDSHAVVAQKFARELQKEGIYVTGFFYPVVPKGQARIRTQMSAAHTPEQITRAVEAFTRIGKQLGVIA